MGIFSGKSKDSNSGDLPDPAYRVEYTDVNGLNSETAYTAESAETKAEIARENGASGISINPFKRGR